MLVARAEHFGHRHRRRCSAGRSSNGIPRNVSDADPLTTRWPMSA